MVGISRYTVAEYLRRAGVLGITWPVPDGLDDAALERRLFSPPFVAEPSRPQPDWPRLHAELRRPGVTLLLLWEEYRAGQPEGYGYSRFCDLHVAWRGKLSPTMRQTHPAGRAAVRGLCRADSGRDRQPPPARCVRRRSSSPPWARLT